MLTLRAQADQVADIPPYAGRSTPWEWHLVVKNGNFTFLPLELILADQLAEWQFHQISTVRAHIGISTADLPPWEWHTKSRRPNMDVKNGDFTFLLLELTSADQVAEWQIHISTVRAHIGRSSGRSNLPSSDI